MNSVIKTLFLKELRDFFRHPQSLTMFSMVLTMNLLLSFAIGELFVEMTVNMSLVMIGFYCPAFLTTEEKEKKTLTALLLTPISIRQIILGRASLYALVTFVVTMGIILIFHFKEIYLISSVITIALGSLFFTMLGMGVGLIAKKQSEVSAIGTVLLLFMFLPELLYGVKPLISKIALTIPIHHILGAIREPIFSIEFLKYFGFTLLFSLSLFIWVRGLASDVLLTENNSFKLKGRDAIFFTSLIGIAASSIFLFSEPMAKVIKIDERTFLDFPYRSFKIPYNESRYEFKQKKVLRMPLLTYKRRDNEKVKIRIHLKKLTADEDLKFHVEKYLKELSKDKTLKVDSHFKKIGQREVSYISYEGSQSEVTTLHFVVKDVLIRVDPRMSIKNSDLYQSLVRDSEEIIQYWK
ncbi:MAG: hypothetical protein CME70_04375 [Halobacteriovorax sp.]|nr:hypothetical protein [Halobacteriovorax sp.]|tara:strand:+ start:38196 stop:39422 length:1227 start_codon:yes stop_codon:yes gene_type:complete